MSSESATTSAVSRRAVLSGGAVGAVGVLADAALGAGPAGAAVKVRGCVDVHAHAIPPIYRSALRAARVRKISGLRPPSWSPAAAVRFMDRHDIAVQVLSLPDPGVSFLPTAAQRIALAQEVNNYLHRLRSSKRRRIRGRFGAFATLPLAGPEDVPAAVAEARRALDLGFEGVSLFSNYGEVYLGDPRFAPLLAELSARGATVFLQANQSGTRPATPFPPVVLEGLFHTTRSLVQMAYLQSYTLHPGITWVVGDGGGVLPYLAYRVSLLLVTTAAAQNAGLADYDDRNADFSRLWFDTAGSSSEASMAAAQEVVDGNRQIVLGTDWPFSHDVLPRRGFVQPELARTFRGRRLLPVARGNARRLFPQLPR